MGTEFYIVKPEKREVFYLGKHFNIPENMPNGTYKPEGDFLPYEDWDDFFWDILRENADYFRDIDVPFRQLEDIIYKIYEWCEYDKVFIDHDCHSDSVEWLNWKETGSISDAIVDTIKEGE